MDVGASAQIARPAGPDRGPAVIRLMGPPPPVMVTPEQSGLKGEPWMRDSLVPGGDPRRPPLPTVPQPGTQLSAPVAFAQAAALVRTPEQVASLLQGADGSELKAASISFDVKREDNSGMLKGFLGAESAQEVLISGRGVCRDTHALARDLLQANGYKAELLGYLAADQVHAVTAYQDPKSGYWGIIEYGTIYPAAQLQAHSAAEALLKFRPAALVLAHYENNGPMKRSAVDGLIYMPAVRVYQRFMAGPATQAGDGVTAGNGGVMATATFGGDKTWQLATEVVTDPRFPYLQGAVMVGAWKTFSDAGIRIGAGGGAVPNNTAHDISSNQPSKQLIAFGFVAGEEYHPDFLAWRNIAGSGVQVGVSSHTSLQLALAGGKTGLDMGAAAGMSRLTWQPEVTADRDFAVWNRGGADTRVFATYGLGLDAGLLGTHYVSGGRGFPVNQYVCGGVETNPCSWLGVAVLGYVPITNHTNDVAAEPLGRLELSFPYVKVGTTQGATTSRYDISAGINLGPVQIGAFCGVDHDRATRQVAPVVGGRLGCTW